MIPSVEECLRLLKKYQVPGHVIEHSRKVCEIAVCLSRLLNRQGAGLDEGKIAAASWLHDIAKMDGLHRGENHSTAGAKLLKGLGYSEISEIVRQHVVLDAETYKGKVGEAMIVQYADKRVKHTALVSLADRFDDLKERYGKEPPARRWLEDLEQQTKNLEIRIFERLAVSPDMLGPLLDEAEN